MHTSTIDMNDLVEEGFVAEIQQDNAGIQVVVNDLLVEEGFVMETQQQDNAGLGVDGAIPNIDSPNTELANISHRLTILELNVGEMTRML